ncbi:MAG: hypothetical protein AAB457_01370 [Patescibacteria group bacterium]
MNKIQWCSLFVFLFFLFTSPVSAQQVCQQQDPCAGKSPEDKVSCYSTAVDTCKNARETLSTQINYMNNQIRLLILNIENTKNTIGSLSQEINEFGNEINRLEIILNQRLQLILKRIPESYKRSVVSPFNLVLLSQNFSDLTNRVKYLMTVQGRDANLLFQVKATQNNYSERKLLREKKKQQFEQAKRELERQNTQLTQQKQEKDALLAQTRGQEAKYQQLLAQALAEKQAIQAIISGGGSEVQVGGVNAGDKIASVIQGESCNSSGSHSHFIVSRNGNPENPFNFLKGISYENCSGYSCGDSNGDLFNPSGSWEWPMDGPIKFNQGYGKTWAIIHTWVGRIYSFHNGIDILGSSLNVKAVQPGILYRGSYVGSSGCSLKYVKVDHKDSDIDTYYLHVNYF